MPLWLAWFTGAVFVPQLLRLLQASGDGALPDIAFAVLLLGSLVVAPVAARRRGRSAGIWGGLALIVFAMSFLLLVFEVQPVTVAVVVLLGERPAAREPEV